jgi:hypothetical protein
VTNAADYPAPGSTTPVAQIDAFLATLDAWRADRGTRLVELDERVQLHGSADEREAIALAFVLWKSVGLRLEELHAARARGRPDDCRSVADIVWTAVTDETGAVLTTDLREAVNGVEDIWSRVEQLVSLNETARRDLVTQRAAIEADLTTAERLAATLGDQVRQVAELRRRFTDLAAPAPAGQTAGPDEGDGRRADLDALASTVASTTQTLVATDDARRRLIESLGRAEADLDRLRGLEAEARALAERCRAKIASPPNLAVPSVDALEDPPTDVEDRPWPGVRPQVERFLDRVSRLDRALREAITRYGAPLQRRDELRGLLQAYRDKADHKGIAERSDVDAAYQAARQELWSAPCRIDEAGRLVTEYQRIVNASLSAVDGGSGG